MLLTTEILQLPNPQIKHCPWGASGLVRGEPWIKYLNNWIQSCKSEVPGAVRRPSKEMILKQDLKDYLKWTKRRQESSRRRNMALKSSIERESIVFLRSRKKAGRQSVTGEREHCGHSRWSQCREQTNQSLMGLKTPVLSWHHREANRGF